LGLASEIYKTAKTISHERSVWLTSLVFAAGHMFSIETDLKMGRSSWSKCQKCDFYLAEMIIKVSVS